MKKYAGLLLAAALSAAALTGCTEKENENTALETTSAAEADTAPLETTSQQEAESTDAAASSGETEDSSDTDAALEETQNTLEELADMVGKSDDDTAGMLGGGEVNMASDGTTQIGRIFTVQLFGETVEAGTLLDEAGNVSTVTMQLENPDASVYEEQIVSIYGEPSSSSDEPSEGGATWKDWTVNGTLMRLYQQYELSALEFTPITEDTDSAAESTSDDT